jgi:hypothetical protein
MAAAPVGPNLGYLLATRLSADWSADRFQVKPELLSELSPDAFKSLDPLVKSRLLLACLMAAGRTASLGGGSGVGSGGGSGGGGGSALGAQLARLREMALADEDAWVKVMGAAAGDFDGRLDMDALCAANAKVGVRSAAVPVAHPATRAAVFNSDEQGSEAAPLRPVSSRSLATHHAPCNFYARLPAPPLSSVLSPAGQGHRGAPAGGCGLLLQQRPLPSSGGKAQGLAAPGPGRGRGREGQGCWPATRAAWGRDRSVGGRSVRAFVVTDGCRPPPPPARVPLAVAVPVSPCHG